MLQEYLDAVQEEMSYVGGSGAMEDCLWDRIKQIQKRLNKAQVAFPDYEDIECTQEDWV